MRKMFALLVLCLLGNSQIVTAQVGLDPYTHFFNETFGNLSEELDTARDDGKEAILLFFEMDECPFCHFMKQNVLNQPEVQAYYREHFLSFPIDIEGDVELTDFSGQTMPQKDFAFKINRVRATPVIAFYDLDGKQILRYTGRTANAEEFMWMGEYIVDGHYKTVKFSKFKRAKRAAAN